jgi:hypothetical protein
MQNVISVILPRSFQVENQCMQIVRTHPHRPAVLDSFSRAYSAYMSETVKKPIAPAVKLKQIAIPTEHGSWGFLFEPIVAGLGIAFSGGGLFIALMTIGAFLVRQPLKMLVIDRLGMRVQARAAAALKFVLIFGAIFVAGLVGALYAAGGAALIPFLLVLPLAAIQQYFDYTRQSRNVLPEIGGAVAISAAAAAILLAGGATWMSAIVLWAILAGRLIPSILYVRERLLMEKGKPHSRLVPLVLHAAAFLLTLALAAMHLAPWLAVVAMVILLFRAVEGLSANRRKMKAMKIGVFEVVFGTLTVLLLIAGYRLGI